MDWNPKIWIGLLVAIWCVLFSCYAACSLIGYRPDWRRLFFVLASQSEVASFLLCNWFPFIRRGFYLFNRAVSSLQSLINVSSITRLLEFPVRVVRQWSVVSLLVKLAITNVSVVSTRLLSTLVSPTENTRGPEGKTAGSGQCKALWTLFKPVLGTGGDPVDPKVALS